MKNFIFGVIVLFVLTGCVVLDTAIEIADIWVGETPIHCAEVQSITKSKYKTTIFFTDGYNYEVEENNYIRPGDKVNIFETASGYRAETKK